MPSELLNEIGKSGVTTRSSRDSAGDEELLAAAKRRDEVALETLVNATGKRFFHLRSATQGFGKMPKTSSSKPFRKHSATCKSSKVGQALRCQMRSSRMFESCIPVVSSEAGRVSQDRSACAWNSDSRERRLSCWRLS